MKRSLRLVPGEGLLRDTGLTAALPCLESQPFRPGEMPTPLRVELSAAADRRAREGATLVGVPLELWIRVACEASRQVERALRAGVKRCDLVPWLDHASRPGTKVIAARGSSHAAYASRLCSGGSSIKAPIQAAVTLRLPDGLLTAWATEAAAANTTIDGWVSARIDSAPEGVVAWEAAAAVSGDSLGEWILARALEGPG